MNKKVVVIGLDGADWRLLKPWIEQGELPTLARLVREGASGPLRSTIRPESSIAWSSFATGVNPGRHGVFGFVHHEPNSYDFKLANGATIGVPRFWDYLGRYDLKVGLVNVPFTYPPTAVNGVLVSGMLTPSIEVPFTYPPQLQEKLLNHFNGYRLDASEAMQDKETLVESVRAYTEQQLATTLLLMTGTEWDCFVVVFTGPDRLQHFLWADMDENHPWHQVEGEQHYADAILAHYRALDTAVHQIQACCPPGTLLMVMSDHGFNGVARRFYVNQWLRSQGWLAVRETHEWRAAFLPWLTRLKSNALLRRFKRRWLPDLQGPAQMQVSLFRQKIDWRQTKVYYAPDGGLRINLKGREPQGVVQPGQEYEALRQNLREALLAVTDPVTSQPALSAVFFGEELYDGSFAAQAPDLILEPQRAHPQAVQNFILDGTITRKQAAIFDASTPYSGNHALDGILIAWGQDVLAGHIINEARIIDLAPTILAALAAPIPASMDGRLLTGLFEPGHEPTPTVAPESDITGIHGHSFTPEQETAVAKRLRDLGYLD